MQYVLGIVASIILIRRYNLIGTGYYWMMYSVSAVISTFSMFSQDRVIQVSSLVVLVLQVALLAYSIIYRKSMKEPSRTIENTFNVLSLAAVMFVMAQLVNISVRSDFYIVEGLRLVVGGLVLGGVTTTMLLGHWYLVQPGMSRAPIVRLTQLCIGVVVVSIMLWLFNPSMISVITGSISDGWGGTLGYMWVGSCFTTIALLVAARLALNEKSYTAVMATTGLLYLAILVANGVELIPRVIFA